MGLVAGATDIPALKAVRAAAPSIWILCPGVGAQGGDAQTVCSVGLRKSDGYGLLVSGEIINNLLFVTVCVSMAVTVCVCVSLYVWT